MVGYHFVMPRDQVTLDFSPDKTRTFRKSPLKNTGTLRCFSNCAKPKLGHHCKLAHMESLHLPCSERHCRSGTQPALREAVLASEPEMPISIHP